MSETIKDVLTTSLTLANDICMDPEALSCCCARCCCCCPCSFKSNHKNQNSNSCCLSSYMKYEIFVSLRIYIGVFIHLIELFTLLGKNGTKLAIFFSIPICSALVILVTVLVVYDVKLVKRVKQNQYDNDYDLCCPKRKSCRKYKSIFKWSILFLCLFKILSVLVSVFILLNLFDEIYDYRTRQTPHLSFENFFLVWSGIDCVLTLVTFIPNCVKFIISGICVCREKNWQPHITCCCNICSCLCTSFWLIIIFITIGSYFGLAAFLGFLLPASILLIFSCILTCVSWNTSEFRTSKVDVSGGEVKTGSRTVCSRSYWAENLNFICDVFNSIAIILICIYYALYATQVPQSTTSTTKKTT
jgi:hypothetical protein